MHAHRCEACGHVFRHERPYTYGLDEEEAEATYAAAHCCPQCGAGPWKVILRESVAPTALEVVWIEEDEDQQWMALLLAFTGAV